ncbi:MAG: ATP synthase F1 subunit epsilon [Clostridiales bacterium]|nr:ATP synthase F1 subunit epsilon [Clostridiales bacterium]MDD6540087.1 ATP synthase F1 subunit epsilon [Bacillota bacterium]MDD7015930.1 ATP synthase F1 subunit epsilon [Bacillota bacterium]
MANTVKLEIVTPEKHFYRGEVELVIARTLNGDEGFMAGHTWGCKLLDIGELWIREPEAEANTYKLAAVGGGFIDIKESIIIFADSIEWKKDIDVDRANREKEAAEDWLRKNEESAPEYEVKRVRNEMKKCEMRLQVAEGGRMAAKH